MSQNIGTISIDQLGQELEGMFHGSTLNSVVNLFGVYDRAARRVMEDVDPQETKIYASFGKVYNGVFDYPLFTDLKGNKVVDLYPSANRTSQDNYSQVYNKNFGLTKNYSLVPDFTPKYSGGTRTFQLEANNLLPGIQVNAMDNVNDNGTWVAGGSAVTPANNNLFFTSGVAGSVQTNLTLGGSQGYLENSTLQAVDLTNNYNNNSDQFVYVYLPNASSFSSIEVRFGSSSSKYYVLSGITTNFLGNSFVTGWNLIKIPFTSVTATNSPNIAAINYIRITFNYDGTLQNQVLINQFYSRIGFLFTMEYYSKYLFRDETTGIFQEKVTDVSNIINLDTDGLNLFLFASGIEAVQQMQGADAMFADSPNFEQRYATSLATYKNKYKSEITKPRTQYYVQPTAGYRRFYNDGLNGYSY